LLAEDSYIKGLTRPSGLKSHPENNNRHAKQVLILCLGNEVISDDGFGAVMAGILMGDPQVTSVAEVRFEPVAGFVLIDLLEGRGRVLIIDTIQTGHATPGTLHRFSSDVFVPARHLTSSHQISLPTAIELGRKLGLAMPDKIDILAVEAADLVTLSEELTPAIACSVEPAVAAVKNWIEHDQIVEIEEVQEILV
jgi:hydrogenase maturation protease